MNHIDYYKQIILDNENSSGGSGGVTPTGTIDIDIQENGVTTHDVTNYAEASVTVDVPEPSGEVDIVTNGKHDVSKFATANVNVPTVEPTGTEEVALGTIEFGQVVDQTIDVTDKANVHVTGQAQEPTGTLNITENGEKDVTQYASVDVNVPSTEPSGTAELAYTMEKGVYTLDETADVSGKANAHVTVDASTLEPVGTKEISITANGAVTEDVKDYSSVHITTQVDSGGGVSQEDYDKILDLAEHNITDSDYENSLITKLADYAFYHNTNIRNVSFPNVTDAGEGVFKCDVNYSVYSNLRSVDLPLLENINYEMFYDCYRLTTLNTPNVDSAYGDGVFSGCVSLKKVKLPKLTMYNLRTFRNNSSRSIGIKVLDFLGSRTGQFNFSDLTSLEYLVIRNETDVLSFSSYNYLKTGVNIYVPDSLVDSYKSATNWSKYADQIHPLSEYVEPEV